MSAKHVVIVGGGIAGLSAAWTLAKSEDAPRITVLDASPVFGGKVRTTPFGGLDVDTGPDAFLAVAPAASRLCEELGLADQLIAPAVSTSWIYSRGKLMTFPLGTVLGVPSNIFSLAKLISVRGMARSLLDLVLPTRVGRDGHDPTVGHLIRKRLGNEVADRMIDPLVGGINAGSIDNLSMHSGVPQVEALSKAHRSLFWGASRKSPKASKSGPKRRVFLATPNGMQQLVDTLSARLVEMGVTLQPSTPVTALAVNDPSVPDPAGNDDRTWRINGSITADAIVLATPAYLSAELLRDLEVRAATLLASIRYSSVAMVRMTYNASDVGHSLDGTGFLVPAVDKTLMTACSWSSSKWSRLSKPGQVLFRVSAGRFADRRAFEIDDDVLVKSLHEELRLALSITGEPTATDVTRWAKAFPQYESGHADRVAETRTLIGELPNIALAGSSYDGVGIPACIESGEKAAVSVLQHLR